jgi:hypothetical protein
MALVHTFGHAGPGEKRTRLWVKYVLGKIVRKKYTLDQPDTHARYRANFWRVDVWNKVAWGPKSVMKVLKTKNWKLRFFLALVAACETNAYMAYNFSRKADGLATVDHNEFRDELARALITRNRYLAEERDAAQ